jgi:hypothetical protein
MWDRYAKKIGRISLPKEVLKTILESADINKLGAAVKEYAATGPKDVIMFLHKKFDLESCLLHLSLLGKSSIRV